MNSEVALTSNNIYIKVKEALYSIIKRLFDIVCAILGIILLIPTYIFVKISYLLTGDFGRVIFVQKRYGKNGKEFNFYKFRSMVKNADEVLERLLKEDKKLAKEYKKNKKLKNDPRITKVGNFIRKTSLDELPQFINVLFGNMSLIGNRPYLPREKEDMGEYFEDVLKTKPGLTGYWQVSLRSRGTFKERLEMERYYSLNCGLKMDIKIFFKTFKVVLFKDGAE